jgi:restriction endonuclease Mrr
MERDYNCKSVVLPLLRLVEDGQEHSAREAVEKLVDHFGLSEGERVKVCISPPRSTRAAGEGMLISSGIIYPPQDPQSRRA